MYFDLVQNTYMNRFIQSSEQLAIVNTTKTLVNVSYKNSDLAIHTVVMRMIRNFKENKSTLLIVPDKTAEHDLMKLLESFDMLDNTFSVSIKNSVNQKDLNIISERCAQKPKIKDTNPNAEIYFNILHEKTESYYHNLRHTKIWCQKTWRELLDDYLKKVKIENSEILHALLDELTLSLTGEEYDKIYQNIADAVLIYQRDFELNDLSTKTNPLTAGKNLPDNFQNISYELFTFKEQAQNLGERYGNVIKKIERLFFKTSHQYASDTLEQIRFLAHQAEILSKGSTTPSNYFSSLIGTNKEWIKNVNKLTHEVNTLIEQLTDKKILAQQGRIKNKAELMAILPLLTTAVKNWQVKIPELKIDYIKSANKLNYHDPMLEGIERDATDLVAMINKSRIFSLTFELNSLSVKKQHNYICRLILDLEIMMISMQKNIPFYQWVSFINDLDDKSREIIRSLKMFDPEDWLSLFDIWYHGRLLNHFGPFTEINEESFEQYLHWKAEKEKDEIHNAKILNDNIIESTIKSLKKENPELYNVLFKKKNTNHPVLWKHFLTANAEFLSRIYPFIIVDGDDISEIQSGVIDEMLCIDVPELSLEILHKFKSLMSFYHHDTHKITADFNLTGEETISFTPLQDIHTTGRISLVRNITYELLQFGLSPTVFRIKNAAIISCVSDYTNECLVDYFYKDGIKKMDGDQTIQEIIIGSLLDSDIVVYILIEDFLIHPTSELLDFLSQRQAIKNILETGCIVLNIDSVESFESNGLNIRELFNQIKSEQLSEYSGKKQLSIEFH